MLAFAEGVRDCGWGATLLGALKGIGSQHTGWLSTDDPTAFGESFGQTLYTVAEVGAGRIAAAGRAGRIGGAGSGSSPGGTPISGAMPGVGFTGHRHPDRGALGRNRS